MAKDITIGETIRDYLLEETASPQSLSEMEAKIRQVLKWLGNIALHLWIRWLAQGHREGEIACPCGGKAKYQRERPGRLKTLFGEVKYTRGYYLCPMCHQGTYPLDEQLGLRPNGMSAEMERLAGLTGVQMPFQKGSEVFEELTLISLSDQSLDKAAQAYGQEVEKQEREWHEQAQDMEELLRRKRENKPPRLYGTLDGGLIPTRAPTGEPQPWRELKIGAWFVARGQPPRQPDGEWAIQAEQISYYADILPAEGFSPLVWATA